ncbi:MAG: hypothetical protein AAF530_24950 [Pseudomonadota bacterium]
MTRIVRLEEIEQSLPEIDIVKEVRDGFIAYSRGEVVVPPIGELLFPDDNGEMHIKYGAIKGDDVFIVKIAAGFFGNPDRGLPPFGGCVLVLSSKTGMVLSVLLEEGVLTNHRTAAAGAVTADALAERAKTKSLLLTLPVLLFRILLLPKQWWDTWERANGLFHLPA